MRDFETTNRKLEQFLHLHKIFYKNHYKSDVDNMTIWVYSDTQELRDAVMEYMKIYSGIYCGGDDYGCIQ